MRVLIAEDDVALASFLRKGLEAEHYAVDVSHNGEQARAMAGEFDYDLLMLELNLPGVDGISVLRQTRAKKPRLPILVVTSRNRVEDRVQCLDLGADDHLGKPFRFPELSGRVVHSVFVDFAGRFRNDLFLLRGICGCSGALVKVPLAADRFRLNRAAARPLCACGQGFASKRPGQDGV